MRKILLAFCLLFFGTRIFAQQYAQYNTGTLFDSFENPSQKSFIPDTSRQFASNFFIPNFDANLYLTGDAQQTLKYRVFDNYYLNNNLKIGAGNRYNYLNANADAYMLMLKMFTSLNGNSEAGFFIQSKANVKGAFTDESVGLLNGSNIFRNNSYDNIFNSKYNYQLYNQIGFSYREQITKQVAFGIKLAYVSGMYNSNVSINQSHIDFDKLSDTAGLYLTGTSRKTGQFSDRIFNNPGVSLSTGITLQTNDHFIIQANIKDLGFIHWNTATQLYNFSGETEISGLSTTQREESVYTSYNYAITNHRAYLKYYDTPLDGTAELSVSRSFPIDDNNLFKYSPTFIASKELFYNGFTGVLVNPVSYHNYTVTVTTSYDDMKLFDFGGQFMIKSGNAEFFIGSAKFFQTGRLALAELKSESQINETGSFTGADIFLGFSMKFGPVIEHPMNASKIPMGDDDKGFLGKLWNKVFHPNAGSITNN